MTLLNGMGFYRILILLHRQVASQPASYSRRVVALQQTDSQKREAGAREEEEKTEHESIVVEEQPYGTFIIDL